VAYLFSKCGVIGFPPGTREEAVLETALEAGAEDVQVEDDGGIEVITTPEAYARVADALRAAGLEPAESGVTQRAATTVSLGLEDARKMVKLLELLEDLDDVQQVHSNADIDEDTLAGL
jgi:transcriptional/translational regulatory protein YebC/TACO1